MDYIEKVTDDVRNHWFGNHKIKWIDGESGFQRNRGVRKKIVPFNHFLLGRVTDGSGRDASA